ncbi:MAG: MTH938/NDUFAF3 family protein [Candidatus Aenigmatarchaeota archaeon]
MPKIDNTYFGSIIIDGRKFNTDMIVCWDGEIRERAKSHVFDRRELEDLLMKDPEVVIVGTGQSGLVKIDSSAEIAAKMEGIDFIVAKSPHAVQEFNKLARRKKAIAVIHVTC